MTSRLWKTNFKSIREAKKIYLLVLQSLSVLPTTIFSAFALIADYAPKFAASLTHSAPVDQQGKKKKSKTFTTIIFVSQAAGDRTEDVIIILQWMDNFAVNSSKVCVSL